MEQARPLEPVVAMKARKTYVKPQLVEYGQVGEVTQSGATPSLIEDTIYFLASG